MQNYKLSSVTKSALTETLKQFEAVITMYAKARTIRSGRVPVLVRGNRTLSGIRDGRFDVRKETRAYLD